MVSFLIGLFIGGIIGYITACFCFVSGRESRREEEMKKGE